MSRQPFLIHCTVLLTAALLSACQSSSVARYQAISNQLGASCTMLAAEFRSAVGNDDVSNASAPPVPGFPLLHTNRFLAALAGDANNDAQLREWIALSAELASSIRQTENGNLRQPWSNEKLEELAVCSQSLANNSTTEYLRQDLVSQIAGPSVFKDNYVTAQQWFGLYPLLRPFLRSRVLLLYEDEQRWFAETESFQTSMDYRLEGAAATLRNGDLAQWMQAAYRNSALKVPQLEPHQLELLWRKHAPVLHIEQQGSNDLVGSPAWRGQQLNIDTNVISSYTQTSYTSFAGSNLLQLNYVFWFPARNPVSFIDLYSGLVDSIIWRVTLDETGQVLLYDSIHSCGCYHKYYKPTAQLLEKSQTGSNEPANIFDVSYLHLDEPVRITITSNDHYIVGLDNNPAGPAALRYPLLPYVSLNSLPNDSGHRSMFDSNGLIPGSQRLERFTLWPTGILSVGAMRQWGTHATGFIRRQHFDDASLLDTYFEFRDEH